MTEPEAIDVAAWNADVRFQAAIARLPKEERRRLQRAASILLEPDARDHASAEDAVRHARALWNGHPHELRLIDSDGKVASGIFKTPEALADASKIFDGEVNIYIGLNGTTKDPHPVRQGEAVADAEIAHVSFLGVDIDPLAEEGDRRLMSVAGQISDYLMDEMGWPEAAIFGSSGRGLWLYWSIKQENTPANAELRRRVLQALHHRWSQVDISIHNASRIARLFGTVNIKSGRRSALYRVTQTEPVTEELLERVAAQVPNAPEPDPSSGVPGDFDVYARGLAERGIGFKMGKPASKGPGTIHELTDCPFYPGSHPTAATITAWDDGHVSFACLGRKCQEAGNGIIALRALLGIKEEPIRVKAPLERDVGGLDVMRWDDVDDSVRTRWFWKDEDEERIPAGAATLFVGRGDLGKTTLQTQIVARATRGELPGDFDGEPVRVLYVVNGEVGYVKAKRLLRAAGVDPAMVAWERPRGKDGRERLLSIPSDIDALERLIRRDGYGLIAFDNIEAHIEIGGQDAYVEHVLRQQVMTPLRLLAQATGIAITAIKHPPKGELAHIHDSVGGSGAWINASRSAFYLRKDPDATLRKTILMIHMKNNEGTRLSTTMEYTFESWAEDRTVATIRWGRSRPEVTDDNFNADTYRTDDITAEVGSGGKTPAQVARAIGQNRNTVKQRMRRMADRGQLRRTKGGLYVVP
jgi:hypothetical protein